MFKGKKVAVLAMVCAASAGITATAYGAESTYDMRKKAVSLLGIMTAGDANANVTRAEFARMLVNASDYRHVATTTSNVSVFADVLSSNEYASAIRTAASKQWMSGYLGGNFKPDQGVTYQEAIRAVMTILGYSNEDFSGNITENRNAKFSELSLDSNIFRDGNEVLTRKDCINLFYNLMKVKTKNGGTYGAQVFELTFASDGEVNISSILDNSLKGPKILNDRHSLKKVIPFSLKNASMFLNGTASDEDEIDSRATVVYYHEQTKTIFAYSEDGENKGASEGEITAIYYDSADPFTPVTVELSSSDQDNEEGADSFRLSASEIQYLFSIYGDFKVGDDVVIVWEKTGTNTYTAVDVVGND